MLEKPGGDVMTTGVEKHYSESDSLVDAIATSLRAAGIDPDRVAAADLAPVDEFHIRGRTATLALADAMAIDVNTSVLDIGSGLGGPARTLAEEYGCRVTGIDLTPSFCAAASELSRWTGLDDRTTFQVGDACALPFDDDSFDAAMTIHAVMNIPDKSAVYREAHRVLKPGGLFAIYDVLQGEGGDVLYPVPWAREPSISHLATPAETRELLAAAGFELLDETDSTEESLNWFQQLSARVAEHGPPPVSFGVFLGADFPTMAANQVANLTDRRIRTVSYLCRA
jgi:ubiquinone/menaquinone biosynthesis C-methylase UbiE